MEATCFREMVRRDRNAELGVNTIFYILMGIVFVLIVGYGVNKMFFIEDKISDMELAKVEEKLEKAVAYCDDPMNSGNKRTFNFNHEDFNSICVLGDDYNDSGASIHDIFSDNESYIKEIYRGGDNVVLLNTVFVKNSTDDSMESYRVISSLRVDSFSRESFCKFDYDNDGEIKFEMVCD